MFVFFSWQICLQKRKREKEKKKNLERKMPQFAKNFQKCNRNLAMCNKLWQKLTKASILWRKDVIVGEGMDSTTA